MSGSDAHDKTIKKAEKDALKARKRAEKAARAAQAAADGYVTRRDLDPVEQDAARRSGTEPLSPAERSAQAAEAKVRLERWRTFIAAIAAVGALLTVLITLPRGCGGP
ncbi:MAG: hypothetical protein IPM18_14130 [Phycisphaerales bacterium]|nr:hypothetical protein [Phycisphaerales bacterium]